MRIENWFRDGIDPRFVRIEIGWGKIQTGPGGLRLSLKGAPAGRLSDAEVNDLHGQGRRGLPWRPPVCLEVRARASHPAGVLRGTAGFGFWNNPFDPTLGTAAAPNGIWFFYASPPAHMPFVPGGAPHGWKAATLNSGNLPQPLVALGVALLRVPLLNRLLYRVARHSQIKAGERLLSQVNLTAWHTYRIDWRPDLAVFAVDGQEVLRSSRPPTVPLGFTVWMDNNCASEQPGRDLHWDFLAVDEEQWLEVEFVRIET
jgi:hypothetical protein